jgi:transcriptional regulator
MSRLELLQGTLDLLVMRTIAGEPKHGYQIARAIKTSSDEVLHVDEGALYPALHRLEARGWIEARWGRSENRRRAKFYELTRDGHAALDAQTRNWNQYVAAVARVMTSPEAAS